MILIWEDAKFWCEIQAGDYVWQTYEQVYQKVIQIGAAIRAFGVKPVSEECCSVFKRREFLSILQSMAECLLDIVDFCW